MKLSKHHITGSLVVCVAAGAFAAGALFVEPDDNTSSQAAPLAAAATAAAPAPTPYGEARSGSGTASATPTGATMTISDFAIGAARVAPGARVTVVNRDSTTHTVTAKDGSFSTGNIRAGASVTFVAPRRAGTYKVFCEIHPSMTSRLTVG